MNPPSEPPLVSVIMPAHGMGPYIGEALESVAAQTHPGWEVVVVEDHGPEDGTEAIVRDFAGRHPGKRVEFVRHPENKGVSAARNTAIAAARGEFLAFLDPDDIWFPTHLRDLTTILRDGDGASVAVSPVEVFQEVDGKRTTLPGKDPTWLVRRFPRSLSIRNFIQPSSTVVKRDAVLALGGFDTDPGLQHIEDYDLWIRLVEAGHRFVFHPARTSGYRQHGNAATADPGRMAQRLERLHGKHPRFFREGREWMVAFLAEELHTTEERMKKRLDRKFGGPLLRTLLRLDAFLGRLSGGRPG